MCAEDGVVLDDGVTGRLGPDHYMMSTTSSGAATVRDLLEHLPADRPSRLAGPRHADDQRVRQHQRRRAQRPAAPRPPGRRRRSRPRGLPLHARPDGHRRRRRRLLHVADRVHRRAVSFEIHVPAVVRPARVGGAARHRAPTWASPRSASRRSGSCGWRRVTSSSARTPTASRRPTPPASTGSSSSTSPTSSASPNWCGPRSGRVTATGSGWCSSASSRSTRRSCRPRRARLVEGSRIVGPRHIQPDVPHAGAEHRPRVRGRTAVGGRDRRHRPPGGRHHGAGHGHGPPCPLRPRRDAAPWLTPRD